MTDPIRAAEALAASCRSLLEEVARMGNCIGKHTVGEITAISDRAAAWLQENPLGQVAQSAPPAEGEVGDEARYLTRELRDQADDMSPALELFGLMHRAADLLQQRHPTPMPVSERLPGPEDCDGEGRCWIFMPDIGTAPSWRLVDPRDIGPYHTHWLPATALPLPAGEGK